MDAASREQLLQRAVECHRGGDRAGAEAIYREVLREELANADALNLLGVVVAQQGDADAGAELIRRAIAISPEVADFHVNLGEAYRLAGRLEETVLAFGAARRLKPEHLPIARKLATLLGKMDRHAEAATVLGEALAHHINDPGTWSELAAMLERQGAFAPALACWERAISLKPDSADARLSRALMLLLHGDWARGWEEYEWRWKTKGAAADLKRFPGPRWEGSDPRGKTVLLYAEQGLGDTIHFVRYATLLAKRGARVIVACQPEVRDLVATVQGVAEVVTYGQPIPPYDFQSPLLGLPRVFGTTVTTIPAQISYLRASEARVEAWRQRLAVGGPAVKVGLAWAGNPEHPHDSYRSCPLQLLEPLALVPGVQFYSLQKGASADEAARLSSRFSICDLRDDLHDFSDTAGLVANLDLVISVDTAVAHLAGALGRPVWTLLPFCPDWRWQLRREDCSWYPTMRLFRKTASRDWLGIVTQLTSALAEFVSRRSAPKLSPIQR